MHAHLCCPLTGRAEAGKPQLALCEAAAGATLRALAAKGARRQTKEKWSTICFKHQNDLLAFGAHFSLSLSCSRLPAQQPLARTHDPICIQRHTNKQHGPSSLSLSLSLLSKLARDNFRDSRLQVLPLPALNGGLGLSHARNGALEAGQRPTPAGQLHQGWPELCLRGEPSKPVLELTGWLAKRTNPSPASV